MTRNEEPGTGNCRSAPPLRTWRPMAAWTAAILLALGLTWFVAAVVVPVWQAKRMVRDNNPYDKMADMDPYYAIDELGGPERAARKLGLYLRMPLWIAGPDGLAGAGTGDKSHAILLLSLCGKSGVPPLIRELHSPNPVCRTLAARSLGAIGPDASVAVPELVAALNDQVEAEWPTPVLRYRPVSWAAMRALGRIGPRAGAAVPRLAEFLEDARKETREFAGEALSHMGVEAKAAAPTIRKLLSGEEYQLRAYAAISLAGAGETGPDVIGVLIETLGPPYSEALHEQAATALAALGGDAKEVIPALERLLDERYAPGVRSAAAAALTKIRGEEPKL